MGLFSMKPKSIKIPSFQLGVFGKLPFYKDFLYSSFHPAFAEVRQVFDQGFDQIIRTQCPRPFVGPDRRLFFHVERHKMDLVACIWESDDGLRGFPFLLAAPFPRKVRSMEFHIFWAALEQFWSFLDRQYETLRSQDGPSAFYAKVRGVSYTIPPLELPAPPPASDSEKARQIKRDVEDGLLTAIRLTDLRVRDEKALVHGLSLRVNPSFVMWPAPHWREQSQWDVVAYLGASGLGDLRFDFFLPQVQAEEDASEQDTDEIPVVEPEPPTAVDLDADTVSNGIEEVSLSAQEVDSSEDTEVENETNEGSSGESTGAGVDDPCSVETVPMMQKMALNEDEEPETRNESLER